MSRRGPNPPTGAGKAGTALWRAVLAEYELEEHELLLLREAVRTVDALDALKALVQTDGAVITSPQGDKAHPALVEARQQRIAWPVCSRRCACRLVSKASRTAVRSAGWVCAVSTA